MHNWQEGVIGNLAHGIRGVSYRPEHLRTSFALDVAILLRSTNIQGGEITFDNVQYVPSFLVSDDQIVNQHDIVVCMSNGSKALVGKSAPCRVQPRSLITIGAFCSVFHPLPGVNPSFLFHVFNCYSFRKYIDVTLAGSAINNLRNNVIEQFDCLIPNIDEQSRIAAVLDTVDETITKTEAVIAKLKHVRTGLLHDLLTNGLDEHGQLRDPVAHPEQFQDSPLGRIPKEWRIDTIEKSCSHIVDCPHSTPNYLTDGVLVARTMHIRNGRYDVKSSSRLTEEEYGVRIARLEPLPGDVIFTREAPVGEAFVIPPKMRICLGQRVMLLRPTVGKLLGGYLIAQIYSGVVRQRIDRLTGGTTNPHLNVDEAKRFEIPLPKVEEQQRIVDCLSSHDLLLESELTQLAKLHSLKSGIMDDLLTGRVRVTFENVSKMREQERVFSV